MVDHQLWRVGLDSEVEDDDEADMSRAMRERQKPGMRLLRNNRDNETDHSGRPLFSDKRIEMTGV